MFELFLVFCALLVLYKLDEGCWCGHWGCLIYDLEFDVCADVWFRFCTGLVALCGFLFFLVGVVKLR